MKLWRIAADTSHYSATDLSGKGAETTGGRWNRKGSPMIYASTSRALACLETFVHLNAGASLPLNRYLVEIDVADVIWKRRVSFVAMTAIGWDALPAGMVSLNWGDSWCKAQTSVFAEVPSVIIPEESNVLVNPAHKDISMVRIRKIRKWLFDARMTTHH